MKKYINDGWNFVEEFIDELLKEVCDVPLKEVRIPHTTKEVPYHYFDESEYQMLCGYRKIFTLDDAWKGKTLLLTFDGVGHDAVVYLNGEEIGAHHCGYTAFSFDITDKVKYGEANVLALKVDSRESLNVPPFGFVIDYMTFGGIYRDVYIDVRGTSYIEDAFVQTKFTRDHTKSSTVTELKIAGPVGGLSIKQFFRPYVAGENKKEFVELEKVQKLDVDEAAGDGHASLTLIQNTGEIKLWDTESPNLYELKTTLVNAAGEVIDEKIVRYGYRKAVFHKDGFYLNGKKFKIRGLNRHQSYPYVGYAMPRSMQELDADIMKNELGLNAARTSHYPQSQYFIDRCDEIGLLVFTEFPGWQHIGDADWKDQAMENLSEMILQYRNHPSIILWGVRINESVDDDKFYERTNNLAHALDPTRQTGGVRCYKKGSFLEDVFTYNDFSHSGKNAGCEAKSKVTADTGKPYLVSEYNGHMFPCKSFDWEEKRAEHAMRHARVLNDVAAEKDIAGSFGWCMFDYNTHKDFGSGDRICYHGVMDMFRNPKLAAFVYAAQQDKSPVLEITSSFDIGEHPGCNRGDIYIISNADSVRMYKNDELIKEYFMKDSEYSAMNNGPVKIDDYIGDALERCENMSHEQSEAVKALLNEVAGVGLYMLSKKSYLKALGTALKYKMKISDATALYNKYIGGWGGESTIYRFDAIKDGEVVAQKILKPMTELHIDAEADHTELVEEESYDVALIRIKATDENGNVMPFFNDPVTLSASGPIEIVGPKVISLPGGMSGTYVRTTGISGDAQLKVETASDLTQVVAFSVKIKE